MKKTVLILLATLITFGIYFTLDEMFFKSLRSWINSGIGQFGISHIIAYSVFGIPILLGTYIINRKTSILESLGLNRSIIQGLVVAAICTLPMFVGFAFVFDFSPNISLDTFLVAIVAAGFFEELYFRGFLFGQLFKNTKLGFIPSVFFGALFFGLIHLYQSTEFSELLGIFLITFLGGIMFAWAYAEWNYNIWIPVFLHMLMNLSWELFSVSNNALGGIYSNMFRALTIAFIIGITVFYKKRKGLNLEINRNTIWIKKQAPNSENIPLVPPKKPTP